MDELSRKRQEREVVSDLVGEHDDIVVTQPAFPLYERDLARLQIAAHEHGTDIPGALRLLLDRAELLRRVGAWLDARGVENVGFGLHTRGEHHGWVAALEWGSEAPDSPMVGAASYGTGDTAAEAVKEILKELKLL